MYWNNPGALTKDKKAEILYKCRERYDEIILNSAHFHRDVRLESMTLWIFFVLYRYSHMYININI